MKVFLIDIESVQTRYTCEWKVHFPALLRANGLDVVVIGDELEHCTTDGAFLNFASTNAYKASQLQQVAKLFELGSVAANDVFLFADAWNPTAISVKYMSELMGIPVNLHGMWHAGSYDKNDFLGRCLKDPSWSTSSLSWARSFEQSLASCYDVNWFATEYHKDLFESVLGKEFCTKTTGWPMEYLSDRLTLGTKRNLVLFPHRISPEKQPEIFFDLAESLPEYEFVACQSTAISKQEYHTLLKEAKVVFSANLQETLGISWYEGALAGAIPMVPNRLSYTEMLIPDLGYPSHWTESFDSYLKNKNLIQNYLCSYMENYQSYVDTVLPKQVTKLKDFFCAKNLVECLNAN